MNYSFFVETNMSNGEYNTTGILSSIFPLLKEIGINPQWNYVKGNYHSGKIVDFVEKDDLIKISTDCNVPENVPKGARRVEIFRKKYIDMNTDVAVKIVSALKENGFKLYSESDKEI